MFYTFESTSQIFLRASSNGTPVCAREREIKQIDNQEKNDILSLTCFDIWRAMRSAIPVPACIMRKNTMPPIKLRTKTSNNKKQVHTHLFKFREKQYKKECWDQIKNTSPAPRNKNEWSAKVPPTNLSAAINPARTTDAVPWCKQKSANVYVNDQNINNKH